LKLHGNVRIGGNSAFDPTGRRWPLWRALYNGQVKSKVAAWQLPSKPSFLSSVVVNVLFSFHGSACWLRWKAACLFDVLIERRKDLRQLALSARQDVLGMLIENQPSDAATKVGSDNNPQGDAAARLGPGPTRVAQCPLLATATVDERWLNDRPREAHCQLRRAYDREG
jgi:hypothetical protein